MGRVYDTIRLGGGGGGWGWRLKDSSAMQVRLDKRMNEYSRPHQSWLCDWTLRTLGGLQSWSSSTEYEYMRPTTSQKNQGF